MGNAPKINVIKYKWMTKFFFNLIMRKPFVVSQNHKNAFQYASFAETGARGVFGENAILLEHQGHASSFAKMLQSLPRLRPDKTADRKTVNSNKNMPCGIDYQQITHN
jgi:hypothetical protein